MCVVIRLHRIRNECACKWEFISHGNWSRKREKIDWDFWWDGHVQCWKKKHWEKKKIGEIRVEGNRGKSKPTEK